MNWGSIADWADKTLQWAGLALHDPVTIAFLSPFLLLAASIAWNSISTIPKGENHKKSDFALPSFIWNFDWWVGMIFAGLINAFFVIQYIASGAKLTGLLTIQLSLATTYSLKTIYERIAALKSKEKVDIDDDSYTDESTNRTE